METRERLLEATQDLLWTKGFSATSPRDIQLAAGVGQGSMYHYFRGKNDLALEAIRRNADLLRREVESLLDRPVSPLQRIEDFLTRQRDALRGCRLGRMTFDADIVASEELLEPVRETIAWLTESLAQVIGEAIAAGELRSDVRPSDLAATLSAVVQGGYVLARSQQDAAPFEAAVAGALGLLRGNAA